MELLDTLVHSFKSSYSQFGPSGYVFSTRLKCQSYDKGCYRNSNKTKPALLYAKLSKSSECTVCLSVLLCVCVCVCVSLTQIFLGEDPGKMGFVEAHSQEERLVPLLGMLTQEVDGETGYVFILQCSRF